ncbi:hypothetical protein ABH899_001587 [Paenibacillus sp. RC84]
MSYVFVSVSQSFPLSTEDVRGGDLFFAGGFPILLILHILQNRGVKRDG